MINHLYTALINRSGTEPLPGLPGDHLIDPDFRARHLTPDLQAIHDAIFAVGTIEPGVNEAEYTRRVKNWRAQQLLKVVHCSELHAIAVGFDNRITYLPLQDVFVWPYHNKPPDLVTMLGELSRLPEQTLARVLNMHPDDTMWRIWTDRKEDLYRIAAITIAYCQAIYACGTRDG